MGAADTPESSEGSAHRSALIAVGAGLMSLVAVVVPYAPQALILEFAADGSIESVAEALPSVTLAGYAVGALVMVGLGRRHPARVLVTLQFVGTAVALVAAGLTTSPVLVALAFFVAGFCSNIPQLLAPIAVSAVSLRQRTQGLAIIAGAILLGMYGGRVVLGSVAGALGWRPSVVVMGAVLAAMACLAFLALGGARTATSTARLWRIWVEVAQTWRENLTLTALVALQSLGFFALMAIWTVAASRFVELVPGSSTAEASVLGIAGVIAAGITIVFAARAARSDASLSLVACAGIATVAYGLLAVLPQSLVALGITLTVTTALIQINLVAIQSILSERLGARFHDANAVLVVVAFAAGSLGAFAGGALESIGGPGLLDVCLTASLAAAFVLALATRGKFAQAPA